jgi:photosystem I subunit VIII
MLLATASYGASYLPSILVPLVGLVLPLVTSAFLFIYVEREDPTGI